MGTVEAAGSDVPYAPGDKVFARHPHQDLFTMRHNPDLLSRLPRDMHADVAVFANLADVALNAFLDVPVRIGDVVVVFGQGVVGTFAANYAAKTAGTLIVVDPLGERRDRALSRGADIAVHPDDVAEAVADASDGRGADGNSVRTRSTDRANCATDRVLVPPSVSRSSIRSVAMS